MIENLVNLTSIGDVEIILHFYKYYRAFQTFPRNIMRKRMFYMLEFLLGNLCAWKKCFNVPLSEAGKTIGQHGEITREDH